MKKIFLYQIFLILAVYKYGYCENTGKKDTLNQIIENINDKQYKPSFKYSLIEESLFPYLLNLNDTLKHYIENYSKQTIWQEHKKGKVFYDLKNLEIAYKYTYDDWKLKFGTKFKKKPKLKLQIETSF